MRTDGSKWLSNTYDRTVSRTGDWDIAYKLGKIWFFFLSHFPGSGTSAYEVVEKDEYNGERKYCVLISANELEAFKNAVKQSNAVVTTLFFDKVLDSDAKGVIQKQIAQTKSESVYTRDEIGTIRKEVFGKEPGIYRGQINDKKYTVMVTQEKEPYLLLTHVTKQGDTQIGAGAYKKVKHGVSLKSGQRVAVSVTKGVEKFRNPEHGVLMAFEPLTEVVLQKKCKSSRVLKVIDYVDDLKKDKFYILTEFCNQGTLKERFLSATEDEIIQWSLAMQEAIGAVREKDLLHGDIKADNFFLNQGEDGQKRILLADFGQALHKKDRLDFYARDRDYFGFVAMMVALIKERWPSNEGRVIPERIRNHVEGLILKISPHEQCYFQF